MPITHPNYSELNHEEMAALIGLKAKHVPMLIGSFLEEAGPILSNLQAAIESKDYATIQATAHSIKGSAGNLRFSELQEMAKELEFAGKDADASFDYDGYFSAVKAAVETIRI